MIPSNMVDYDDIDYYIDDVGVDVVGQMIPSNMVDCDIDIYIYVCSFWPPV